MSSGASGGSGATGGGKGGKAGTGATGGSGDATGVGGSARAGRGGATGGTGHGGTGVAGKGGSAGTAGSGGDPNDCVTDAEELDGLSFNVEFTEGDIQGAIPEPLVFRFERLKSGDLSLRVGGQGHATHAEPVTRDSDSYGPALWVEDEVRAGYQDNLDGWLSRIELCVRTGASPSLRARGELMVRTEYDDYYDEDESDFELVGVPDDLPPEWRVHRAFDPADPLTFARLATSEPLQRGSEAWLDEPAIHLVASEAFDSVIAFEVPEVLPLGLDVALVATGKDLAGLAFDNGDQRFRTVPDPGILPLDGFETTYFGQLLRTTDSQMPALVTEDALAGEKSLYVPPGTKVLMHLDRPLGTTKLLLDLKPVVFSGGYGESINLRAGVVGGGVVSAALSFPRDDDFAGSAGAGGAGAQANVEHVVLELSEPGLDVILTLETPYIDLFELTSAGALVDGLTFE